MLKGGTRVHIFRGKVRESKGKARGKQGESKGKQRVLRESKVFVTREMLYSFVLRGKAIRPSRLFIILKEQNEVRGRGAGEDLGYPCLFQTRVPLFSLHAAMAF